MRGGGEVDFVLLLELLLELELLQVLGVLEVFRQRLGVQGGAGATEGLIEHRLRRGSRLSQWARVLCERLCGWGLSGLYLLLGGVLRRHRLMCGLGKHPAMIWVVDWAA